MPHQQAATDIRALTRSWRLPIIDSPAGCSDIITMGSARALLDDLYRTAVAAAHPARCLVPELPPSPRSGRLILLAAGKAAGAMVEVAEQHFDAMGLEPDRIAGVAATRRGYGRQTRSVELIEAGHPVPDHASVRAAERALALAAGATAADLVLVLLSGGASANWIAPCTGLSLHEKQAVNRALLKSGAAIGDINIVRKHLSRIKGGRLARSAYPATLVTLAISDVPGDDPAVIGSGPTVPDPSTLADARAVLAQWRLEMDDSVHRALADPINETPKLGDPAVAKASFHLVARPADSFRAVDAKLHRLGWDTMFLGDGLEGEARVIAGRHAELALQVRQAGRRVVILSGGELTVTLAGKGRGGPNQEYALALALALRGAEGVAALAADTDGIDGGGGDASDPAGAFIDERTLMRAYERGLDPAAFLAENDSTGFFELLGDLLQPGPTFTNVNDFRAILVDPA